MFRQLLILSTVLALACSSSSDDDKTPDAGNTTPDAGNTTPDAGDTTPDAGDTTPDAGEETPDAGDETPDAGDETPDAGEEPVECTPCDPETDEFECECFFNSDCDDDKRCVLGEDGWTATCECGARGTGAFDTACNSDEDIEPSLAGAECASGLCVDGFCTKPCEDDTECDGENLTQCNSFIGGCIAGAD